MNIKPCKYCHVPILMLLTAGGKFTPCEPGAVVRDGSAPPPKGKYYDLKGNHYDAVDVPCKVSVYRSHWGDCPGAKEARRPRQ